MKSTVETKNETIQAAISCHKACLESLAFHGDKTGGRQLSSQHIKRLMACIEMCQLTANMITISAPMLHSICEICANLCEQCATSCEAVDSAIMKKCVDACKKCAGACYEESYKIKQVS